MRIATYILTCNAPKQLEYLLKSFYINNFNTKLIIVDQSTNHNSIIENQKHISRFTDDYEYVLLENLGCSGGRYQAAKLFNESKYDAMFYFEDDMVLTCENNRCRFGFPFYVDNLVKKSIDILVLENLDYLKLSFHEVYNDHSKVWPLNKYTQFTKLAHNYDLSYFIGEIYFSNWPMLITQTGNKKIFDFTQINTEYKIAEISLDLIAKKELISGVLAATPIKHHRIENIIDHKR